jgi:hypothetical protein
MFSNIYGNISGDGADDSAANSLWNAAFRSRVRNVVDFLQVTSDIVVDYVSVMSRVHNMVGLLSIIHLSSDESLL